MRRFWLWALLGALGAAGCQQDRQAPLGRRLFGPSPKELVQQAFDAPDPDLRRQAVERLCDKGWGRREPYAKAYSVLAGDPAPTVRSAALRALGRCGDARYVGALVGGLNDGNAAVRWDAAAALDLVVEAQVAGPLCKSATGDPALDVRLASAKALRHYRTQDVVGALLACLADPEFSLRFQASQSLQEVTGLSASADEASWRNVLSRHGYPLAGSPRPARPWWDWFGVTRRGQAASRPTTNPAR